MRVHNFWAQIGPFALNKFFFGKTINIMFKYLLATFIKQNL